ncbi:hypothetical protein M9H77_02071 [Catharanthus roseus]|uniref:Uncharacterized protein n=1 Tax=Catharanthus roseus TaxID=4058 RepID=A0ACC0C7H5_CATRO|nr:hypothetical protein M9H77_02071 [Catharanthus roseus]
MLSVARKESRLYSELLLIMEASFAREMVVLKKSNFYCSLWWNFGKTRDNHENMKIFQRSATRSTAMKLEEENEEMEALLERTFKIIRERHWKGENEDQRSTKKFRMSIMQVEKAKGIILEDLEDSASNGEEGMNPTTGVMLKLLFKSHISHLKQVKGPLVESCILGEKSVRLNTRVQCNHFAPKHLGSGKVFPLNGYTWTKSSWQRLEAIRKQEMAYSKFARERSNCYKDGVYGGNAYGGSHHRDGHLTHRS